MRDRFARWRGVFEAAVLHAASMQMCGQHIRGTASRASCVYEK